MRRRWWGLTAVLAALLPPLMFPEMLFQGRTFYFMDLAWIHYPLRTYIADLWRSGAWPLWNPYSWNGFPLLAESEVGALSPVNALFLLPLESYQSLNLLILLHVAVAGLSAYALVRQLDVSRAGSLLAALSYACGGYIMAQVVNLNIMIGSAWAPLICALLLRALAQQRARWGVLAGLVFALQTYSSHPQVPYYTLILLGVFTLYGTLHHWQQDGRRSVRPMLAAGACLALTVFIGLGLSAPQWITGLELLSMSRRAQGLASEAQLLLSMPPNSILTFIFPRLFVLPTNTWRTTGTFDEFHFYLGLIPLVCVGLAALKRRELIVRFAYVMAGVTFVLALGRFTPVYSVVSYLPLLSSFRIPARWLFITAISCTILIGKGADAFYELLRDDARRPALKKIMRYVTILYCALSLTAPAALLVRPPDAEQLKQEDVFSIERIATRADTAARLLPEAIGFVALGGLCLAAFWLLAWRRRDGRAFALVAVSLTYADLFFAGGGVPTDPSYWKQSAQLASFVKQNGAYDRIFSTGAFLDVVPRLGDAQPAVARVFASSGENDLPLGLQRTEDLLGGVPFLEYLRLTGTRWLVIAKNLPPSVNRHLKIAQSIMPQITRAWESNQIEVYALPNPLPRAYVVYDIVASASKSSALESLNGVSFDSQRMAVVEDAPAILPRHGDVARTPATIAQYESTSLRVEADAVSDGLLVLTDTFYPGWRVWVDGVEQPIIRTNYLFRGVLLTAGAHSIVFRYWPPSFQVGLLAAGLTAAALCAGAFMSLRLKQPATRNWA